MWRERVGTLIGLMGAVTIAGATSCASVSRAPLQSHGGIPAAQGEVEVRASKSQNKNTRVEVRVEHLAEPGAVSPGANTYVVWARPEGGWEVQNLGALRVGDDLSGTLTTVTPFRRFELFITAERSAQVMRPSGAELLSAQLKRKGG